MRLACRHKAVVCALQRGERQKAGIWKCRAEERTAAWHVRLILHGYVRSMPWQAAQALHERVWRCAPKKLVYSWRGVHRIGGFAADAHVCVFSMWAYCHT